MKARKVKKNWNSLHGKGTLAVMTGDAIDVGEGSGGWGTGRAGALMGTSTLASAAFGLAGMSKKKRRK